MIEPDIAAAPIEKGLFDLVPCGLVVCDAQGIVLRANSFFSALTGLTEDALRLGQPFVHLLSRPSRFIFNSQVIPQLHHACAAREVALDVIDGAGVASAILLNANRDETTGHIHYVVFPAHNRRDQERQLLTAQKEVRQYRDYLEMAERLANVGHWSLNISNGEIYWSPEIYAIYGLDPEVYTPHYGSTDAFYHPEDLIHVRRSIADAIRDRTGFTFRARLVRPDGDIRVIQAHGICERDVQNEVTGLFGICRDVTGFVRSQELLEQSEARYRLLADESNDIITTFNPAGTFEYLSPAVTQVLGYAPEDLIGRNVRDIVHPEDFPATAAAYRAYTLGGDWDNAPRIRYRAVHRDGHFIWAEAHPAAIVDASGTQIIAFQDVVRDISHQKATEEALARASLEANAAAEAKANFLATMSHELRTPLTSIIGFSGLLREMLGDNPELSRYSTRIHTAGQGLLGLINDILDHSKLEAGQLELDLAPASIEDIVVEVADMLEFQASAKGLTITVTGAETLPSPVLVDDARLRQILLNLVGNAIKFTETGGVTVNLSQSHQDGADMLRVAVHDTGPGISEAGQARLFQRFSQVDRTGHDMPGGTGLGLSISKQLTELMSGTIGVHSVLGEGAEFWFEIPLPQAETEIACIAAPARPGRVLVVDDQDAVADLLVNLLTPGGHEVDVACNGYDAVEACRRAAYDLILMDVNMPVMDGFAATRAIRDDCAINAATPILALTAAGGEARLRACLAAGMNAMLTKPVVQITLLNAVAQWMSATSTPDADDLKAPSSLRIA